MESMDTYRRFLKTHAWEEFANDAIETDMKKGLPRAPVEKPLPEDAELIDLVPAERLTVGDMPLREVIARRRSRRRYTKDPLSLEELSFLLWSVQGVHSVHELKDGIATLRSVPSGGSLHPFETYLLVNHVEGLNPGLYRYLPMEHKLLFLYADEDLPDKVAEACCRQRFVKRGAVAFIWTAIPYRTEWKYSIASHKIIAQDAGHMCENLYLASESIGAGTCAVGAYLQEPMDRILGVDGEEEFTICVAPVGKIE